MGWTDGAPLVLLLALCIRAKFVPCPVDPSRAAREHRRLYVATCDTRSGWKEFIALKVWNVTGHQLRTRGRVHMKNVCTGKNWGEHGYLTKPLIYLSYVRRLKRISSEAAPIYVILMDSDTMWAVNDVETIWNKFDCARGQKDVVLSTEMSCWVGRYCTKGDLARWYSKEVIKGTPSYSPFANSGIVMGSLPGIERMLQYVVTHNKSYYITYTKKHKFDDQYAIADYAIKVRAGLRDSVLAGGG